jgi:hypothetical protein
VLTCRWPPVPGLPHCDPPTLIRWGSEPKALEVDEDGVSELCDKQTDTDDKDADNQPFLHSVGLPEALYRGRVGCSYGAILYLRCRHGDVEYPVAPVAHVAIMGGDDDSTPGIIHFP